MLAIVIIIISFFLTPARIPNRTLALQGPAILLGKEQLTRLFLTTGNLTPISDAKAEADVGGT